MEQLIKTVEVQLRVARKAKNQELTEGLSAKLEELKTSKKATKGEDKSESTKHLLDIQSLEPDEIMTVIETARAFKAVGERAIKKVPALRGKTVVNLFVEPSTRTRISFELAALRLSADVINLNQID